MRSPSPQRANERKRAITTIHVLKAQAGMDDDDYRTMLHAQTGKASCKDMDIVEQMCIRDSSLSARSRSPMVMKTFPKHGLTGDVYKRQPWGP